MGNYILDLMIDNYRLQSLQKIVKAYKPSVPLDFVLSQLAFEEQDVAMELMRKVGCVFVETADGGSKVWELSTKDSVVDMAAHFTQEKLLL